MLWTDGRYTVYGYCELQWTAYRIRYTLYVAHTGIPHTVYWIGVDVIYSTPYTVYTIRTLLEKID